MCVYRDKMELFTELAEIFSDDNNQMMAREVLNRVSVLHLIV